MKIKTQFIRKKHLILDADTRQVVFTGVARNRQGQEVASINQAKAWSRKKQGSQQGLGLVRVER